MILSFKKQFPEKILSGSKIHTIREDPHGRWKPGRKIHMATGVRTKKYNCFKEAVCVFVQSIEIKHVLTGYPMRQIIVYIDNKSIYLEKGNSIVGTKAMEQLAKNDGFDSVEDFFKWFSSDFQGRIIHWTDFRY